MKTLALLSLILCANCVNADEPHLDVGLATHHWSREKTHKYNLNEFNPGIGLDWTDGNYHKMVGVYKNSNYKLSGYALLAWTPINVERVHIGAFGGMVTGYSQPYSAVAGLLVVGNLTERVDLKLTFVPTVESMNCYGFVATQLSYKL